MFDDPLINKHGPLTRAERDELKRKYNLPDRATPAPILAKARARSAARRERLDQANAPLDRRPVAAAAFEALLALDARKRAAGHKDLAALFRRIVELVPPRYERAAVEELIRGLRDDALERHETMQGLPRRR